MGMRGGRRGCELGIANQDEKCGSAETAEDVMQLDVTNRPLLCINETCAIYACVMCVWNMLSDIEKPITG